MRVLGAKNKSDQIEKFRSEYEALSDEQKALARNWIDYHLEPATEDAAKGCRTTMSLIRRFYRMPGGFELTHGQMTIALMEAGLEARPSWVVNSDGTHLWLPRVKRTKASIEITGGRRRSGFAKYWPLPPECWPAELPPSGTPLSPSE